jgi:hypothetical protein
MRRHYVRTDVTFEVKFNRKKLEKGVAVQDAGGQQLSHQPF